ncbi:hypothetical protein HUK80_17320 [Flavobacterium sp. MAH-1]|uniref:GLPGLI family protein n=1 Tax=Flavobacterium agri TaxID=2743471 RepID=A0A7Y9C8R2_9FLAO|nr:hypothetical protein [Flavobacterium agri]NUY82669.1 hypothetical protein [Flavobacterium agri]NYA72692.1 hypothetical protein [Flavobacterium agri]
MRKILTSIVLLMSLASWSQKTYVFDYSTLYEYTKDGKEKQLSHELTFSNSLDPDVHLIVLEEKGEVFKTYLVDKKNNIYYEFENPSSLSEAENAKLKFQKSSELNFDMCKEKSDFYEFSTKSDTIHLKRFKDSEKKKPINECVVAIAPTSITKSQKFNFGPFRNPLWCGKFNFDSEGLITYCYFIEKGKKVHFRKLQQIKQTNFTVTVPNSGNTKK